MAFRISSGIRFATVTNDVAFRKIFVNFENPSTLLSFLNAVLELSEAQKINQIVFLPYYYAPLVKGENATIILVKAICANQQELIIELQMTDRYGFANRITYHIEENNAFLSNASEASQLVHPDHFIAILDFNFFETPAYLSHNLEREGKVYASKDTQFTFIELPKFYFSLKECNTLLKQWLFFIKNGEQVVDIPKTIDDKGLLTAYQIASLYNWDKETLRAYDNASIALQDARGRLSAAERKGLAKGMEQGLEQGKLEEKKEVIKMGLAQQMPIELLAKLVNLPTEQVQAVINQLNL